MIGWIVVNRKQRGIYFLETGIFCSVLERDPPSIFIEVLEIPPSTVHDEVKITTEISDFIIKSQQRAEEIGNILSNARTHGKKVALDKKTKFELSEQMVNLSTDDLKIISLINQILVSVGGGLH